jgi:unsaturated rhamnogalacturonyl hydrolase
MQKRAALTWAEKMADSYIKMNPYAFDSSNSADFWDYGIGCVLKGMESLWIATENKEYYDYIKKNIECSVSEDGNVRNYDMNAYNADMINNGKMFFLLYRKTKDKRYKRALDEFRLQMKSHPRTSDGGFWHKKNYPYQMWLDGLYMISPLLSQFGAEFGEPELFDEVSHQLLLAEKHTRDPKTGLLYHAWDETREMGWADRTTGLSPHIWSRAMGWYMMAIVDILDFLPADHPKRGEIIGIFERLTIAIGKAQDSSSGVWYQITDMPDRQGNYLEASASCMFVYAIAKGVRKRYLSSHLVKIAERGFAGIVEKFISENNDGTFNLENICGGAGLGWHPERGDYRDGSFNYYVNEKIIRNDRKGIGPFILAAVEMEFFG